MSECVPLTDGDGKVIGSLMRGPSAEKPLRKRRRLKFCFGCRKKLPHMLTMAYDPQPSYYEPIVFWKCSGCGDDDTLFPGWTYDL